MRKISKFTIWVLATLSGVLYFLGFVGFDQWYLAYIALVPLLIALHDVRSSRQALLFSWWTGIVAHLGGYYWVVHLLINFASLPLSLAVVGYLLLCLVQGAIFSFFGLIAWKLKNKTKLSLGWIAPLAWVTSEFVYPQLFPSYFANSQAWTPYVTQVVDLFGVLLLSAILALVNGAIGELIWAWKQKLPLPRALLISAACALIFTVSYSAIRISQIDSRDKKAPQLKVAIVQGNVGAGDKHINILEGIKRYRRLSDEAMQIPGIGLLVWPESGLNKVVNKDLNLTGIVASEINAPMLVGALRGEGRSRIWNSILNVAPGGKILNSYDKIKLLIFGEYVPGYQLFSGFYQWLQKINLLPYLSVYERGSTWTPLNVGPYKISTNICYEDILPGHINDLMKSVDEHGQSPHAMVNVTNDSWYGPVEPRIHLALATFRAIEHRRWLVRSTATGISAFIDSSGRVVKKSNFESNQLLVENVPMISSGPTIYGLVGDCLGWLALATSVFFLVRRKISN